MREVTLKIEITKPCLWAIQKIKSRFQNLVG
jgi:hypothetical protein